MRRVARPADLPEAVEAFIRREGMSATRFGYLSIGDPSFVADLRRGREVRNNTLDKVVAFIYGYGRGLQQRKRRMTAGRGK